MLDVSLFRWWIQVVVMAGLEFFVARHLVESYEVWGARSYLRLEYAKACRHRMGSIFRYPSTCQGDGLRIGAIFTSRLPLVSANPFKSDSITTRR